MGNQITSFCNCMENTQLLENQFEPRKNQEYPKEKVQVRMPTEEMIQSKSSVVPEVITKTNNGRIMNDNPIIPQLNLNHNGNQAATNSEKYPSSTSSEKKEFKIKTITYDNGDVYQGETDENYRNGKGKLTYANGNIYEGYFVDNLFHGKGELIEDSMKYVGEFHDGTKHGFGVAEDNQSKYEGQWKEDKKCGLGKEIFNEGSVYQGSYFNGVRHGDGLLFLSNGSVYEGEFKNNKIEGKGIFKWNEKKYYRGEWKNNNMDGFGFCVKDNNKFIGYFRDNMKNGIGLYYFYTSNTLILGKWINDKQNDIGIILNPHQSKLIIEMENNTKINTYSKISELGNGEKRKQYDALVKYFLSIRFDIELIDEKMNVNYLLS